MIQLRQPHYFSFIGSKDNQEDYLYPQTPGADDSVFILCDGMGGHERGEVASSTVAEALGHELSQRDRRVDPDTFNRALAKAYDALDNIDCADSDRKPGTTLTCLCFNDKSYLAAHIGDSRIYHIRPSSLAAGGNPIVYRSEDHSLVNDLVKAGQITPEEARHHPRRNVITRAMQPRLENRFPATIHQSADVLAGDYFFLCSDGVLEQLSDETLCHILASSEFDDAEKIDAIKAECNKGTRDNYTACLIPVETGLPPVKAPKSGKSSPSYTIPLAILIAIIIVAGAGIAAYYLGYLNGSNALPATAPVDTVAKSVPRPVDTIITDRLITTPPDTGRPASVEPQPVAQPADRPTNTGSAATTTPDPAKQAEAQAKAKAEAEAKAKAEAEAKAKAEAEAKAAAEEAKGSTTKEVSEPTEKTDNKTVPPRPKKSPKKQPTPLG